MSDTAAAIRDLLTYLKQYEIRQTIGTDLAFNQHNDRQYTTKLRYQNALESGQDLDFIDALESSPCPHHFVVEAIQAREAKKAS